MLKKLSLLVFLFCLLPTIYASAQITIDATYGIEGKGQMGSPMRVNVTITNDGEDFKGHLLTSFQEDYQLQTARVDAVELASGKQMDLSFFIDNYPESYVYNEGLKTFTLYEGEVRDGQIVKNVKVLNEKPTLFNYDAFVVGTIQADEAFTSLQPLRALTGSEVVIEKLATAQEDARDYAFFDVLVVDAALDEFSVTEQEALVQWVKNGGQLLVDQPVQNTAFESFEALLYGENTTSLSVEELNAFAKAGTFSSALIVREATVRNEAKAWTQGETIVAASTAIGKGYLIQTAFSLTDASLLATNGYSHLMAEMIDLQSFTWKGYPQTVNSQIANQLTNQNELFDSFAFSIWKVIAVLALYILVIGPVLYVILKKKDKREHAWWLVPIISLVFSLVFFAVGAKDRLWKPQLQEMMLWAVTEEGAKQYFTQSVLANKAGDYAFTVAPDVTAATYYATGMPQDLERLSYREKDVLTVKDVPYWGVKSVVGSTTTVEEGYLEQHLQFNQRQLTGTVTNHFAFPIEQVKVWAGMNFYDIGSIEQGETVNVQLDLEEGFLVAAAVPQNMWEPRFSSGELQTIREESLLRLAGSVFSEPLLVAQAPTAALPSQLTTEAKITTNTLIAQPLVAEMVAVGELTVAQEDFRIELTQQNYSEWLTPETTEWYFEKQDYTLKFHLPKMLQPMQITWLDVAISNEDERLRLEILNHQTAKYEPLEQMKQDDVAPYVQNGVVQFNVRFVGNEIGDLVTLPTLTLKGEVVQ